MKLQTKVSIAFGVALSLQLAVAAMLLSNMQAPNLNVPLVIIKRSLDGTELASEGGKLYHLSHAGTDGMIVEFIPESIFKDGFDPE